MEVSPYTFPLSPFFPFCDILCDSFVTNIGLHVIICQALCDPCLDVLVV